MRDILSGEQTIDDTIVEMFERDKDNHGADILREADRIKEKRADESRAEKKRIEDKLTKILHLNSFRKMEIFVEFLQMKS